MKTTHLNTNTIDAMFNQLKYNFGGSVVKDSKEYILEMNNEIGVGRIQGIALAGGISYVDFDMTFAEDITLSINTPNKNPIYFAYCSAGSMEHSFGINGDKSELESFQTGIIASPTGDENVLYFKKDERLKVALITVQTTKQAQNSKKEGLKGKLFNTFFKDDTLNNFVYVGSQNLKIAEKVQQISAIKQEGLVKSLLLQGLVHVILALEIEQHTEDSKNNETQLGTLTTREMSAIKEASAYIDENFDSQISISQLCSEFGISPSKLQEGFKLMHGRTVTDHLRTVRVQKAENYLKNTDMNISEVVYSIGFSSRSYFSKIFKESYNCSPSEYKMAQRELPISA
ncbi:AraC family transcriptional regulator [Tamlana sp. 2_MG-2023]|uniref:helix-turn-helix domain-containing protein n=1 Tax=unclassified Tamlana TaxID=2614803 RepID=UPI0026E161E5|nr:MULTISPECIES: AraC family transcriptional regulator [unclassified Tamlana]MDO6760382.1 AraC family transcriptional regulator [Tamlana sp. 2_MG-2023]MDO6789920.1 AraC family transcriptional regulator [Tamlana sp. 1_MG-2023]